MSQSFSLPIPDPLPPTVNERLLEAKHKAVTINIMFTANKAASKITSTQVGDVHNKNLILRLAPRAVTEVLKTVYGVEIPVASVEQYYVDIQQNAAYLKIPWNQDEAAKLIGSLFGTHTNNPKDIEALFHEVTTFFEHHYKLPLLTADTKYLLYEAQRVARDSTIADKYAMATSWENQGKPTSSPISDPELKYEHNEDPQNPFSGSVSQQVADREMSDSPPEA